MTMPSAESAFFASVSDRGSDPSRHSLSGGGFVLGPLLYQKLTLEFALSAAAASALFELLRISVETALLSGDLKQVLAQRLDLTPPRVEAALAELSLLIGDPGGSDPLTMLEPLLSRLTTLAPAWYSAPLPAARARTNFRAEALAAPRTPSAAQPADLMIVTGFLGAGKTTLVNELLRQPRMEDTLVFVNEAGETGLDHLIVRTPAEGGDILLLAGGCLCCRFGESLIDDLRETLRRRAAGEGPSFGRILIETSGIADPTTLIDRLGVDREIRTLSRYRGTVVAVDAAKDIAILETLPEAAGQLAAADWIVLTKADLVDGETLALARAAAGRLNPDAHLLAATAPPTAAAELLACFQGDEALRRRALPPAGRGVTHQDALSIVELRRGRVDAIGLRLFCDLMMAAKGDDLYRMKGFAAIEGAPAALLLQAVRGTLHEARWRDLRRARTALVLIGHRIESTAVSRLFDRLTASRLPPPFLRAGQS